MPCTHVTSNLNVLMLNIVSAKLGYKFRKVI